MDDKTLDLARDIFKAALAVCAQRVGGLPDQMFIRSAATYAWECADAFHDADPVNDDENESILTGVPPLGARARD